MHGVYHSSKTKSDFIRDIKYVWKILYPEKDDKGRIDETLMPYVVRHLNPRIDKSREKRRQDKLTWEEYEKILKFFSSDPRIQCYLSISLESLGRPQEILYTRIKDVELSDNYAKIWISEHGKEGTGFLQCIESYPYLTKWLDQHPLAKNPDSFLFINLSDREYGQQLKPKNINNKLKTACKYLKIDKPITPYSLKRNGVTFRRLKGESDMDIQHAARWTSTKQLKTYDLSNQEDAMKIRLVKLGLVHDARFKHLEPKIKTCLYCDTRNDLTAVVCKTCKRPLDREQIKKEESKQKTDYLAVQKELETIKEKIENSEKYLKPINAFLEEQKIKRLFIEFLKKK
jgi:integrase